MRMLMKKSTRTAISVLALFSLLLCQATWAGALATQRLAATASGVLGLAPSCHDLGSSNVPDNAAPSPCDSAQLPGDSHKISVFDSSAPAVPIAIVDPAESDSGRVEPEFIHRAGAPPPLRLLLCKLLN